MTDSGYRHIIFIIDRSGSMQKIRKGMQSGFEEFTSQQAKEPGRVTASLWQFDTQIERLYAFQQLDALAGYRLIPRGGTAMYDAIAEAVIREGEDLASLPEEQRPSAVVVIVVSDGAENSSVEYNIDEGGGARIAEMLAHQQDAYGWSVVYMGTNQDAFKEGAKVGIQRGSTLSYVNTNSGSHGAWIGTSQAMLRGVAVASASGGGPINIEYSDAERKLAEGAPVKREGE